MTECFDFDDIGNHGDFANYASPPNTFWYTGRTSW